MTPISHQPSERTALLERLKKEAAVSVDSANNYSVRSWLTSAKKCLDQVGALPLLLLRLLSSPQPVPLPPFFRPLSGI